MSRNGSSRGFGRSKLKGATVALALLAGTLACGTVSVVDAQSALATPPVKCKQSPDGQSCTQGDDGTGGGTPWVADDFYMFAKDTNHDYYARYDGAGATYLQGYYLADNLAYLYCYVPNHSPHVLACEAGY